MSEFRNAIVWFRRDLRLEDNPALSFAVKNANEVTLLYIHDAHEASMEGAAGKWWLHYSLENFTEELKKIGGKLTLRSGRSLKELKEVITAVNADCVVWNRRYEPELRECDRKVKEELKSEGVAVESFNGALLIEPWCIRNKQGNPYKVYTAFWNVVSVSADIAKPLTKPKKINVTSKKVKSLALKELDLLPKIDWAAGFRTTWKPGRKNAVRILKEFLKEGVTEYDKARDIPSIVGTSRLSPYLHYGEISAREVWDSLPKKRAFIPYLRQIVWREFATHLLFHFPETPKKPLYEKFERFPWKANKKWMAAWTKGQTGYPIVDAGMRELWTTGWMHNRVRMIVASFLVKDLFIPWQEGAKWFWDTLVDADMANNTMGWQWVAGCGADASPFFRIFNPVSQGEKFDKEATYVRRWVPELSSLPNKWIHQPWEAPESVLEDAGIKLGKNYAKPIVDHNHARREALRHYEML